jgi:hypothetical protein
MTPDQLRAICSEHSIGISIGALLREHDVSRLLEVCTRTLRSWRAEGIGPPAVRIGAGWRYPLDALAVYMSPEEPGETRKNPEVCDIDTDADIRDDALELPPQRIAQR